MISVGWTRETCTELHARVDDRVPDEIGFTKKKQREVNYGGTMKPVSNQRGGGDKTVPRREIEGYKELAYAGRNNPVALACGNAEPAPKRIKVCPQQHQVNLYPEYKGSGGYCDYRHSKDLKCTNWIGRNHTCAWCKECDK